ETHLADGRLQGELTRTTFQLRLLAEEVLTGEPLDATIDHADPDWGMGPRPDLRRVNVPLGVIGVFGASNFPFAFSVMGGDSAAGLAAGCAVVHKIHEAHPELGRRTAEVVTEGLASAGAPEGLFLTVTTRAAGEALVDHPLVRAVSFTGSARVGRLLLDRATSRPEPIPFYGELGSINPVFVTRRAWAARGRSIAAEYVQSYTLGMGQFCTKPGLLFTPRLDDEDRQALVSAVREVSPTPMLTPQLAEGFLSTRSAMAERGLTELVAGGTGTAPAPALFTTTVADVRRDPAILREEMFGPASIVVEYDDDAALTAVAELVQGQLTATVHGEEGDDVGELLATLEARTGRVLWNGWPTGVSVTYAQQHGGPYPATTSSTTTSVGTAAVRRFLRPVAYQNLPDSLLPPALQEDNPWGITRRVDGRWVPGRAGAQ
ncbi:aldehyde dehydrogenase (NADP(+)), partial [uncultured Georgenia sp.]|uniref:aldehyde dehydrogenase (NADP(+)) n=1 Tax=uncultured Georgenia sp. TaxID=378209 RepID=UPI0026398109